MGLLDNLRKKAAEAAGSDTDSEVAADATLDGAPEAPSDDSWLQGVERRRDVEVPDTPETYAAELLDVVAEAGDPFLQQMKDQGEDLEPPYADAPAAPIDQAMPTGFESPVAEDVVTDQDAVDVPSAPVEQPEASYPDVPMIYAGLAENGLIEIAPGDPERQPTMTPAADLALRSTEDRDVMPSIERGPIGPEAAPLLHTLGLGVGCTWGEVTRSRGTMIAQIAASESVDVQQRRTEINHAYATLRLLRLGPLKV